MRLAEFCGVDRAGLSVRKLSADARSESGRFGEVCVSGRPSAIGVPGVLYECSPTKAPAATGTTPRSATNAANCAAAAPKARLPYTASTTAGVPSPRISRSLSNAAGATRPPYTGTANTAAASAGSTGGFPAACVRSIVVNAFAALPAAAFVPASAPAAAFAAALQLPPCRATPCATAEAFFLVVPGGEKTTV